MNKNLSSAQVLARMHKGDLMFPIGFASDKGVFDDGSRVSHAVVYRLLKNGKIQRPEGTSIHSPFTLTQQQHENRPAKS
jgi:hypothetical protein